MPQQARERNLMCCPPCEKTDIMNRIRGLVASCAAAYILMYIHTPVREDGNNVLYETLQLKVNISSRPWRKRWS